jgi:hypothetical protein
MCFTFPPCACPANLAHPAPRSRAIALVLAPISSVLTRTFLRVPPAGARESDSKAVPRRDAQKALLAVTSLYLYPQVSQEEGKTIALYGGLPVHVTASVLGEWNNKIKRCLPDVCAGFVNQVIQHVSAHVSLAPATDIISPEGMRAACRLLEGLAPCFSVEGMLPRDSVQIVRQLVAYWKSLGSGASVLALPSVSELAPLREASPELWSLINTELLGCHFLQGDRASRQNRIPLCQFLLELCTYVETTARADIAPPPFSRVDGSYDPPKNGVALYFTDHGEMGRWPRRYGPAGSAEEKEACTKQFAGHNKRTGGVFR